MPPLGGHQIDCIGEKIWTKHLSSLCTVVCRKVVFKGKKYLNIHFGVQNWYYAIRNGAIHLKMGYENDGAL